MNLLENHYICHPGPFRGVIAFSLPHELIKPIEVSGSIKFGSIQSGPCISSMARICTRLAAINVRSALISESQVKCVPDLKR